MCQDDDMSVEIVSGDLFESRAQTLVNAVNCVGVMGKGIALEFKRRYPDMFTDYVRRCNDGTVKPGLPYIYKHGWSPRISVKGPWILNFPTKRHWRDPARLDDIIAGLDYVRRHCYDWAVTSMAVPALGVGNGGLDWDVVLPVLQEYLARLQGIEVKIFEPLAEMNLCRRTAEGVQGPCL